MVKDIETEKETIVINNGVNWIIDKLQMEGDL